MDSVRELELDGNGLTTEEMPPNFDTSSFTQDTSSRSTPTNSDVENSYALRFVLGFRYCDLRLAISRARSDATSVSTKLFFALCLLKLLSSVASQCEVDEKAEEILKILASFNRTLSDLGDRLRSAENLVKAIKKDDDPVVYS